MEPTGAPHGPAGPTCPSAPLPVPPGSPPPAPATAFCTLNVRIVGGPLHIPYLELSPSRYVHGWHILVSPVSTQVASTGGGWWRGTSLTTCPGIASRSCDLVTPVPFLLCLAALLGIRSFLIDLFICISCLSTLLNPLPPYVGKRAGSSGSAWRGLSWSWGGTDPGCRAVPGR